MRLSLTAILLTASSICLAHQEHHHHQHGSLGAHEHGIMQMDIALEGEQLYIALQTPAGDLVGFEHAPETMEQQRKLEETLAVLGNPQPLFALDCTLDDVKLESPLIKPAAESHDTHADIHVQYQLYCKHVESLDELDAAGWFRQFPATEAIQVQLISDVTQQQASARLTPANSILSLD